MNEGHHLVLFSRISSQVEQLDRMPFWQISEFGLNLVYSHI